MAAVAQVLGDIPRGFRVDDAQIVVALVRRCVAGDTEAWEDIVRQYNRRIYNVCYRFTGSADSAEDLAPRGLY